ncbi:hypothetical protein A2U01_0108121 [Trifolium medium]|uniref:Uncharacterized protein n=1 Tax=Trifolium medium TaxID=97028 RepID=A0A392VKC9_9FABA|nr:hypothetical protein [Trifolium medium]
MSQINARPGMEVLQVLCRTGPEENHIMPHQSVSPAPHLNHPAAVGDVSDNPDSKHPEHGSDAPSAS